jgi:hypothetical protein
MKNNWEVSMKNSNVPVFSNKGAISAGLLALSGSALAAPITISDSFTITDGSISQNGNSIAGMFDINDLLPDNKSIKKFNVIDANVSVFGFSNANTDYSREYSAFDLFNTTNRTENRYYRDYYSYTCSWCWSSNSGYRVAYGGTMNVTDEYFERDVFDRYVDDVRDQMTINVEGDTSSAQVGYSQSTQFTGREYLESSSSLVYDNYSGVDIIEYDYYYQDIYSVTDIWAGGISSNFSLSEIGLLSLEDNGMLGFSVEADVGSIYVDGIGLSVTLDQRVVNSVPAPPALFLFLLATVGLVKRFNSQGKPVLANTTNQ